VLGVLFEDMRRDPPQPEDLSADSTYGDEGQYTNVFGMPRVATQRYICVPTRICFLMVMLA
jgi:hypothetical protein